MVLDQVVWRPLTIAWSFAVGAVLADGSLVVRSRASSPPRAHACFRTVATVMCVQWSSEFFALLLLIPLWLTEPQSKYEKGLQEGHHERPCVVGAAAVHQLSLCPDAVACAVHRHRSLFLVRPVHVISDVRLHDSSLAAIRARAGTFTCAS